MRLDQQLYLADVVRDHREHVDRILSNVREHAEPLDGLEARLLLELTTARLLGVEAALRTGRRRRRIPRFAIRSRLRARVHPIRLRLRAWAAPQIGTLRHHPPKALLVPTKYFRTDPPRSAPTISIVTPSFQQGKYLERTLYSVINQNYPALEYVVQDGGSTDETLAVLQRFEHLLTDWVSETDEGQADAINHGFSRTSGEIMAWLNSDDLLLPGSLCHVAQYFSAHPEVDIVYGHRVLIDDNDFQIGSWILPRHDNNALKLADFVPQETLFWRRRIWEAAGAHVNPTFRYAMDWELLLRMVDAGARIVRLPRLIGAFRVHDTQKTVVDSEVGLAECMLLRQRVHGRGMSVDEVLARLVPYMLRHVAVDKWYRLSRLVPKSRRYVRTIPLEPWLRAAEPGTTAAFRRTTSPLFPVTDARIEAVEAKDHSDSSQPSASPRSHEGVGT